MDLPTEMQHQAMGYDRAATMFSPDGHLLQVEYAEKTVKLGSSSIGIVCKDGVVIVADRRIRDKLVAPESMNKVFEIDSHLMASASGLLSDARVLVEEGQVLAQQNRVTYGAPIEPILIIKRIADRKQMYTQYGGARPYGVAFLIAGVHNQKPQLYTSDMTGHYLAYRANAIGEHDEKIKEILRRDLDGDLTMQEAIPFALKIFKEVLDKNFDIQRFDVGMISAKDARLVRVHGDALKKFVK
ncbi:archaeal proteasome endopeptidase complex subunit alpha [Candidatus Pacearchaeota archaeon]|nr:archaeal proteasome endopeptidase complex subunit alpha [Candidatus Pacearchaeota archaeon]